MIRVWVCEDCETIQDEPPNMADGHIAHKMTCLESTSDDREYVSRVAVKHLLLSKRIRSGGPYGLADYRADQSGLDEAMPYNAAEHAKKPSRRRA